MEAGRQRPAAAHESPVPMTTPILIPKLGFSMNEGTLVEWLAADGSAVQQGQPLFSLESDKSVQDIECPASGRLRVLKAPGGVYPVGTVIGEIL